MIQDGYWKKELSTSIRVLKFWKCVSTVCDTDYVKHKANKHILLMAVAARKMVDDDLWANNELEQSPLPMPELPLIDYKVSVTEYPFTGDKDWIVPGRIIASDYGKASGIKEILLNKLCSQIIHSFLWSVAGTSGQNGFSGFLVASDREKDKRVYYVTIDDWITAMKFCIEKATA